MAEIETKQKNLVEASFSVFQANQGKVKIFLTRKAREPYKGYWTIPGRFISTTETVEECLEKLLENKVGLKKVYCEQGSVFSALDRMPEERIITLNYVGLVDAKTAELQQEDSFIDCGWFDIDSLPKLAYDHEKIIASSIEQMKQKIDRVDILKILFPSDFTLPELQRVCEQIMGKSLDRRNFRKKFVQLGVVEDTGYKNDGGNGRPAKLYRFKDQKESDKVHMI